FGVPERQDVAVREWRLRGDGDAVDQRAVAAPQILDHPPSRDLTHHRMPTRHRRVRDGELHIRGPADRPLLGPLPLEGVALTRAAGAGEANGAIPRGRPAAGRGRSGGPTRDTLGAGTGDCRSLTRPFRAGAGTSTGGGWATAWSGGRIRHGE